MGIVRAADDVEAGVVGSGGGAATTTEPLLRHCKEDDQESKIRGSPEAAASDCGSEGRPDPDAGSLRMVLLSTAVAVCGSFEFGTCVRTRRRAPPPILKGTFG